MISLIKGKIVKIGSTDKYGFIDLFTNSGVGYRVIVVGKNKFLIEDEITLYTSFQVREDSQSLYGFISEAQRDFFELLISVSGVGPKIAVSILSTFTLSEVATCIVNKDHKSLATTPGLGSKGAQKIVVELENRLGGFEFDISETSTSSKILLSELSNALKSLGFTGEAHNEYMKKGESISKKVDSVDELIKLVLKEN